VTGRAVEVLRLVHAGQNWEGGLED
jgi:hypothetical protein